MESPFQSDEQFVANVRAKSARQVLGEFIAALGQLVLHLEMPYELTDLSVNFHGRALRVDVAALSPDGEHLAEWLVGLNADVTDPAFGSRVSLPTAGPVQ
jgi:hypothetical protein